MRLLVHPRPDIAALSIAAAAPRARAQSSDGFLPVRDARPMAVKILPNAVKNLKDAH